MRQFLILLVAFSFVGIGQSFGYRIETVGSEEPMQALEPTEKGIGSIEKSVNLNTKNESSLKDVQNEDKEIESDSSYYSVNKFNILFYFVYKLKYGDDELPTHE